MTSTGSSEAGLLAAGPFVVPSDAACPPDFLALARGGDPLPMAFVRATGSATLETARDAYQAGLALPSLLVRLVRFDPVPLPWGGTLKVPVSLMLKGKRALSMPPFHLSRMMKRMA